VEVDFQPLDKVKAAIAKGRDESPETAANGPDGVLNLNKLMALAANPLLLSDGDVRLVGWYDQGISGMHPDPAAPQARRATLVVVNLQFGQPAAAPDKGLRTIVNPLEE
jgi:hypothetical protein